jgi:predicted nucleic acid-binding protein
VAVVDTSVWIDVFRDRSGAKGAMISRLLRNEEIYLTRFTQFELLQGAKEEREWGLLSEYLDSQSYLELAADSWLGAARIHFDLKRRGKPLRSPIDCCIAQLAMEHDQLLFHRDRDFETIAEIRPLRQERVVW